MQRGLRELVWFAIAQREAPGEGDEELVGPSAPDRGVGQGLARFVAQALIERRVRGASGLDSPNCGCREPTRTGTDGAPCVSSADCAPGFICNQNGNTLTCRQLCLAGAGSSECALKTCMPLATYPKLGVCL